MVISKGLFVAVCLIALFFAAAWVFTYVRSAKAVESSMELETEDAKLKSTLNRLNAELDREKARVKEQESVLKEIGSTLEKIKNPLVTLRQVYGVLENYNMAYVTNSPLAFVNEDGKNAFGDDSGEGNQVFERIKRTMTGGAA